MAIFALSGDMFAKPLMETMHGNIWPFCQIAHKVQQTGVQFLVAHVSVVANTDFNSVIGVLVIEYTRYSGRYRSTTNSKYASGRADLFKRLTL